ncbi:MAG: NAD(P)H-hydrate dehydratase [Coraliomargaritaceae bacterium]
MQRKQTEAVTHFPFLEKPALQTKQQPSQLKPLSFAHPILDCRAAASVESKILGNEEAEWAAMSSAGAALKQRLVLDYQELRPLPQRLRVLALLGKGNNAGDALIACQHLLADYPRAQVDLLFIEPVEALKALPKRALQELTGRVHTHFYDAGWDTAQCHAFLQEISARRGYHICLDGLLGMSFQPPLRSNYASLIDAVNQFPAIDLRAAVDLPSGCSGDPEASVFKADMTYTTGIAKAPLFQGAAPHGRVRYLDLGFFQHPDAGLETSDESILLPGLLDSLRTLRPPNVDKRSFGHLYIIGGSSFMPGALLMAVQAALRSGVGLVTAFAPVSVAATLAAQVPEAMWVPWPETSAGTLSPKALPLLTERLHRADAVLIGPGMGADRNTDFLTQQIVSTVDLPIILDADALRPRAVDLVRSRKSSAGPVVITPHMGEFIRIAKLKKPETDSQKLIEFSSSARLTLVLKGPITRLCDGKHVFINTFGGPVLSRGGSGDLLAGLIGGMIAQDKKDIPLATARALTYHGLAAERLARTRGQVAVRTTEVLEFLPEVLRDPDWNHLP